jgi:serine/threonine protein phosphatase PrpC
VASLINRFFRKKTTGESGPAPTAVPANRAGTVKPPPRQDVAVEQSSSYDQLLPHLETPQLVAGIAQSIGLQRDKNEDSIFTLTTCLLVDERTFNFGLYIVADGMGGHDNGELASRIAVDEVASHVINNIYVPLISSSRAEYKFSLHEVMQAGVHAAHDAVKRETDGGGTTLTAALILGDQLTITHVGDSRAYSINPLGEMKLLTRDHSLVKRLEEIGQITADQALSDPRRNVLYRALGQGETFEPDILSMQICQGCQLVICSDGLWGVISEEKLAEMLSSTSAPHYICQELVQAANQAGGPDNISVILIRLPG